VSSLTGAQIVLAGERTPGMSSAFAEAKEIAPGRCEGVLDLTMRGGFVSGCAGGRGF